MVQTLIDRLSDTASFKAIQTQIETNLTSIYVQVNRALCIKIKNNRLENVDSESGQFLIDRISTKLTDQGFEDLKDKKVVQFDADDLFMESEITTILPIFKADKLTAILVLGSGNSLDKELGELRLVCGFIGNQLKYLSETNALQDELSKGLINNGIEAFWTIHLETFKLELSGNYLKMLGYAPSKFPTTLTGLLKYVHVDDRELLISTFDPLNNLNIDLVECEYRIRDSKGNYRWIFSQGIINHDELGKPATIKGNCIDITSRVEYEKKIQFKEQEYRNLVNSIHEVIFKIDKYGNFIFLNEAWFRATKYSVLNTLGTSAISYLADEFKVVFTELSKERNDPFTHFNKDIELQIIDAQGVKRWFHAYIQIQFNELGRFDFASGTFINIHQRKKAELAKQDADLMFKSISENMSDVLTLLSPDLEIKFCTPGAISMFGYQIPEVLNRNLSEFIHEEDFKVLSPRNIDEMYQNPSEKRIFQYRIRKKDGTYIWLETIVQLIQINEQDEIMFMCVSRDISKRKAAEDEIRNALEREKELNELKSKFVTMASHEFRTPLTSIHSSVEIMEMYANEFGIANSDHFTKHYSNINKQVKRLTSLMNGILIVGKTDADKMPFNPQYHDITQLCNETIELGFKNLEDEREVDFEIKGKDQEAFVDVNLFQHIITNALSNAFKFSKGKPNPQMNLTYFKEGFEITIKDHGIGIPEDELSNVFNSFYRAENTTNIEGTGLGMVVMKQFVEMHGGKMLLTSEENVGTQVKFEFTYELDEIKEKVQPILG